MDSMKAGPAFGQGLETLFEVVRIGGNRHSTMARVRNKGYQ